MDTYTHTHTHTHTHRKFQRNSTFIYIHTIGSRLSDHICSL